MNRRALQCVDGDLLHQRLQLLGKRGFAPARWPEQVKNLFALFKTLRGMLEEGDDLLDRIFHAVELPEGRVDLDDFVEEQPRQPRIVVSVHQFGLSDCGEHALSGGRVGGRVFFADIQILLDAVLVLFACFKTRCVVAENIHISPVDFFPTPHQQARARLVLACVADSTVDESPMITRTVDGAERCTTNRDCVSARQHQVLNGPCSMHQHTHPTTIGYPERSRKRTHAAFPRSQVGT